MKTEDIIREYTDTNQSWAEMQEKYEITAHDIQVKFRKYKITFVYDQKVFQNRLEHDYMKMQQTAFIRKYGIQAACYHNIIEQGCNITSKKMAQLLRQLKVPYTIDVMRDDKAYEFYQKLQLPNTKEKIKQGKNIPIMKRPNSILKMNSNEQFYFEERMKLINSQQRFLSELLHEKKLSIELINRILSLNKTITKESIIAGVDFGIYGIGHKVKHIVFDRKNEDLYRTKE